VLNFMDTNSGLIVFHEMGTGKTVTGLLCAIDFLVQDINNTVYIVATKTLVANWEKEILQFIVPNSPLISRIFIGTIYDFKKTFKRSKFQPYDDRSLMIIVDESHNYKSEYLTSKIIGKTKNTATTSASTANTAATAAAMAIKTSKTIPKPRLTRAAVTPTLRTPRGKHRIMKKDSYYLLMATVNIAKKVLFLTGTPFRNSMKDLNNMLQMILILNDLHRRPMEVTSPYDISVSNATDISTFMNTPRMPLPSDEDLKEGKAGAKILVKNLKNMIDYEDKSGEFPDYKIFFEKITPPESFLKSYRDMKSGHKTSEVAYVRSRIFSIGRTSPKKLVSPSSKVPMVQSQSQSLPVPVQMPETTTMVAIPLKTAVPRTTRELSGKIKYLMHNVSAQQYELIYDDYIMNEHGNETWIPIDLPESKIVIYSGVSIDYIQNNLPKLLVTVPGWEGLKFFFITGKMSAKARKEAREGFNAMTKNAVLIISPAAKEGVDLKGVGHVYFLDGVWNPAEFEQIMGRAIRTGSHKDYPGIVVQVHMLFDNHKEFPQEIMDEAVKKKYQVMKVFKDIAHGEGGDEGFNVEKTNPNPVTPRLKKQLKLVPIQLTQKQKYPARYGIQYHKQSDDHMDLYQALAVKYTGSIYGPIPDNTAKIFGRIYNHTDYRAFETYFREIRRIAERGVVDIVLIEFNQYDHKKDVMYSEFSSIAFHSSSSKRIDISSLTNMTVFFCSIDENDSGHYGIFIFDPAKKNEMFYYDSMLRSNEQEEGKNYYLDQFRHKLSKYFVLPSTLKIDFPSGIYDEANIYSMEATGGNIDLLSPYIDIDIPFSQAQKEWCIKFQTLCSDNQNQFCYIWSILYMLCKVLFLKKISKTDWTQFIKKICRIRLLPLVVIKLFIKLSIGIMPAEIQQIWKTIPLLRDYFGIITTNATAYNESFNMANSDFGLYNITIKSRGKTTLHSTNLIDTWNVLVKNIYNYNIRLEKMDTDKYKNDRLVEDILQKLQPVLDSEKVFQPDIPMTYAEIVEALNKLSKTEKSKIRFP